MTSASRDEDGLRTVPETAEIEGRLRAELASSVGLDAAQIDVHAPMFDYGLDSLSAITLLSDVETWLGMEVPATLVWDHATIAELADALGRLARGER